MTSPLQGVVILDLSAIGPASRCTRILADLGADLIKVEPPAGGARRLEPPFTAYGAGRNTRRVALNLKHPAGREAFLRLTRSADVVVESYRPGVAARLGIEYATLKELQPRLVYCAVSGFGQTGPYAQWAGHDLNYVAVAGLLGLTRRPGQAPVIPGATLADAAGGGMQAAIAILGALVRRGLTGEGSYLDVSATDGVLYLMALHLDQYLFTRQEQGPGEALTTGRYGCYEVYRCSDGGYVSVGALEPWFWANLCKALDREDLTPLQYDDSRQEEVRAALTAIFATRPRDEWVADLAPRDTCVAPVYSLPEVTRDPHLRARRLFRPVQHPEREGWEQVFNGFGFDPVELAVRNVAPRPGEHTAAVLRAAGYTEPEVADLISRGAAQ